MSNESATHMKNAQVGWTSTNGQYYPQDFDPSALRKDKKKKNKNNMKNIRNALPFSFFCDSCGGHMGIGTKFNSQVETVKGEDNYLNLDVHNIYGKCKTCGNRFCYQTSLKDGGSYLLLFGGRRGYEGKADGNVVEEKLKKDENEDDQMKLLERKRIDMELELRENEKLENLIETNRRGQHDHEGIEKALEMLNSSSSSGKNKIEFTNLKSKSKSSNVGFANDVTKVEDVVTGSNFHDNNNFQSNQGLKNLKNNFDKEGDENSISESDDDDFDDEIESFHHFKKIISKNKKNLTPERKFTKSQAAPTFSFSSKKDSSSSGLATSSKQPATDTVEGPHLKRKHVDDSDTSEQIPTVTSQKKPKTHHEKYTKIGGVVINQTYTELGEALTKNDFNASQSSTSVPKTTNQESQEQKTSSPLWKNHNEPEWLKNRQDGILESNDDIADRPVTKPQLGQSLFSGGYCFEDEDILDNPWSAECNCRSIPCGCGKSADPWKGRDPQKMCQCRRPLVGLPCSCLKGWEGKRKRYFGKYEYVAYGKRNM